MWERAACSEEKTERFFVDPSHRMQTDRTKQICERCELREPCLEYALAAGIEAGIWGGLDQRERVALQRRRAIRNRHQ